MVSALVIILILSSIIFLAAVFAGSETGIYQLSRIRLRLGVEQGKLRYKILSSIMDDGPGLLISILISTNLSHYVITSIVTMILLNKVQSEHTAELVATVIMAPILFVFCELVPKSIFYYRADFLMPYSSMILFFFKKIFTLCGAVSLLKWISRVFAKLTKAGKSTRAASLGTIHSSHIRTILKETRDEGLLSSTQSDIIRRVEVINRLDLEYAATPLSKVCSLDVNSNRENLIEYLRKYPYTRYPVYKGKAWNIIGYINIYKVLSNPDDFEKLDGFIQKIKHFPSRSSVLEAMNLMQQEKAHIAAVTRSSHLNIGRVIGIITMKDLVEELVGELVEW